MTNPIPMDALDVWWTEHGNGERHSVINGGSFDNALVLWNSFKEMQRQNRAPDGYDLDNPALIECATKAQVASDAAWEATKQHGGIDPRLEPKRRRHK